MPVLYEKHSISTVPHECDRIVRVVETVGNLFVVVVDAAFENERILFRGEGNVRFTD